MSTTLNHTIPSPTPNHGTGLVATHSLKPNRPIIRLPSPYVIIPEYSALDIVCSYCFLAREDNPSATVTLKRCKGCNLARYCSTRCQGRAWKEVHRAECRILRKAGGKVLTTAVRAVMGVGLKGEGAGRSKWMDLEGHQKELMGGERASEIMLQAKAACEFVEAWKGKLEEVVGLLCRISTNAFRVTNLSLDPVGLLFDPLLALANHSCTPNAVVKFDGRTVTLQTLDNIDKDEQIFLSYIDPTQDRDARRKELKQRYYFDCGCEKCTNDENAYDSFCRSKIEAESKLSQLLDFEACRRHAEESVRLMKTNTTIQKDLRSLTAHTSEITTLITRIESVEYSDTGLRLLHSAISMSTPFLSATNTHPATLTALTPLPSLLHAIYLRFVYLKLYTPALITLLHLSIYSDVYNYPQPHHPVRLLRWLTISRLMKVVIETGVVNGEDSWVQECGGVVPREVFEVDWVSAVQVVLSLVRSTLLGEGDEKELSRFARLLDEEIEVVMQVQSMRGVVGEKITAWMRGQDGEVEGREYARKVIEGLRRLSEFALPVIGKLVARS